MLAPYASASEQTRVAVKRGMAGHHVKVKKQFLNAVIHLKQKYARL